MLSNKTIIITGAGAGLGEGIAHICHREGANVIVSDVRKEAAHRVAKSLGERAFAIPCDVADDTQLQNLVNKTVEKFGRVDGLVNNAGVNFVKPFLDTTPDEWDRVLNVDLRAVFFLTQMVCRQMLKQTPQGGSIVNISSVHSQAALPGAGPYDAAKCGVVGMSKSIAVELATQGIRVNVISPGLLNTQIWRDVLAATPDPSQCEAYWFANVPLGRAIEVDEVGELVAFLLSDKSSAIIGANMIVDGGMTSQLVAADRAIKPTE